MKPDARHSDYLNLLFEGSQCCLGSNSLVFLVPIFVGASPFLPTILCALSPIGRCRGERRPTPL
jgi:hypothetical protein